MVSGMKRLENYIIEMSETGEIGEELEQVEKKLRLAAQIGKELLEKNEELSRQNEEITEDYARKLEVVEQQKHALRRALEAKNSDCETRIFDLQTDISELKKELEEAQKQLKLSEKEKIGTVTELTEANLKLSTELSAALKTVESLTSQLNHLKEQSNMRKLTLSDHANHLESLRDDIGLITLEKKELEKKVEKLIGENEGLSGSLEKSKEKIRCLELMTKEQEMQLDGSRHENDELKVANQSLSARMDLLNRSAAVNRSLFNEMELSTDFRTNCLSAASSGIGGEEDEIECDEGLSSANSDIKQLKEEVWLAYCTILAMCHQLKAKVKSQDVSSGANLDFSSNGIHFQLKPGILCSTLEELKSLLRSLSTVESLDSGSSMDYKSQIELEMRLHSAEETLSKTDKALNERTDENKRLREEITQLTNQLTIRKAELDAVSEERDNARRDLSETHLAKDEIVKKAWELRDKAVERKNKAEIEVAKTRIDNMQVNSQLIEAVQQKIILSQQLEQWQVDMQQLLDEQMRTKLSNQEVKEKPIVASESSTTTSQIERTRNKLFAIFRKSNS